MEDGSGFDNRKARREQESDSNGEGFDLRDLEGTFPFENELQQQLQDEYLYNQQDSFEAFDLHEEVEEVTEKSTPYPWLFT